MHFQFSTRNVHFPTHFFFFWYNASSLRVSLKLWSISHFRYHYYDCSRVHWPCMGECELSACEKFDRLKWKCQTCTEHWDTRHLHHHSAVQSDSKLYLEIFENCSQFVGMRMKKHHQICTRPILWPVCLKEWMDVGASAKLFASHRRSVCVDGKWENHHYHIYLCKYYRKRWILNNIPLRHCIACMCLFETAEQIALSALSSNCGAFNSFVMVFFIQRGTLQKPIIYVLTLVHLHVCRVVGFSLFVRYGGKARCRQRHSHGKQIDSTKAFIRSIYTLHFGLN